MLERAMMLAVWLQGWLARESDMCWLSVHKPYRIRRFVPGSLSLKVVAVPLLS